jgi:hypothetical protein
LVLNACFALTLLIIKINFMRKAIAIIVISIFSFSVFAQKAKILFDATKAQTAGNADWVIDSDQFDLNFGRGRKQSNPQRFPSPSITQVKQSTPENFWKGGLSAWAIDLAKRGYEVETLPAYAQITYGSKKNPQDLANYQVFVVCEPNIRFSKSEQEAMISFVKNGGGLFIIADHGDSDRNNDGCDSPCVWNELFKNYNYPFGIEFSADNLKETSTNIADEQAFTKGVAGKVNSIKYSNGSSITLRTTENQSAKGVIYQNKAKKGGNRGVLFAYATYGNGRIVALGDSSPVDDGSGDIKDKLWEGWDEESGSHKNLIINATVWLLKK